MIQRIQTVYLAIVLILSFVCLCSTVGEWLVAGEAVADFSNFTFGAKGAFKSLDETSGPWCLGVLLTVVIVLTSMTIMLYRKRMRQLRLTIISTILLVGWVACYALFAWKYDLMINDLAENIKDATPTFHLRFVGIMPVLNIILNCLAIHGIRKDEALVRSLDRMR